MANDDKDYTMIYPGEPGYEEAKKDLVDIPGNKPVSYMIVHRTLESDLLYWKKLRKNGFEYTPDEFPDEDGNVSKPQRLDELIEKLEKELEKSKKVIDWAERKRPGSSRNEDGSLLLEEYEKTHNKG